MQPPTFVRSLSEEEKRHLEGGLRSRDAFTVRRCQILLHSDQGLRPSRIAAALRCSTQTVRDALHAFAAEGLVCLLAKPKIPETVHTAWPQERDDELRALLHQSPRTFGKARSLWTLDLLAEVCFERGMTPRRLTGEAIRYNLARLQINWKRAKRWMTSPDPDYAIKKARRDRLIRLAAAHPDWVLGFEDEVWWSRLAQPSVHAWTEGPPLKVQLLKADENDPDPDAICCYGMLRHDTRKVLVRFVEGRAVGEITTQFLDWMCWNVQAEGKKVLIVIWDEASWHRAESVAAWVGAQNERAKREGGVKVVICELPVASPWLNNIEPCWKHAKKAIMEPERKLSAQEITSRVCQHFGCELLPYLKTDVAPEACPA